MKLNHLPKLAGWSNGNDISIVNRLRSIMISVVLFIILGVLSVYLASEPSQSGLQVMNSANMAMTSITRVLEIYDSSDAELGQIHTTKNIDDIIFLWRNSQNLINLNIEVAIDNAERFPEAKKNLISAIGKNREYNNSAQSILKDGVPIKEKIIGLMIARQFSSEAREILRKSLILIKDQSDANFTSIYKRRFKPLIAAIILSSLFLTFVLIFGFSITRRLKKSLENLTKATSEISKGNFVYQASILQNDEIGHLTSEFNLMVNALSDMRNKNKISSEKVRVLQSITAAFSEAITQDEVFDIVVQKGFHALGSESGLIAIMSRDHTYLKFQRIVGKVGQNSKGHMMSTKTPLTDAVRFAESLFFESFNDLRKKFPENSPQSINFEACAFIPLAISSEVFGAVQFCFVNPRVFTDNDREFMQALARLSAQAIHRSQLFDEAKTAIHIRDEFLSIASHELKTPLTPLKLLVQGLMREVSRSHSSTIPKERVLKIVESSDKQITRLTRLIEDLLDVSRISSGKLTLNKESFNVADMIHEVVKHYEKPLEQALPEIDVEADPKVEGFMDKIRIEQVLINLLTNAGKYASGKPVCIRLSQKKGMARLLVIDQGPGIQPEDQLRIFDRFERVKTKAIVGGLGLGLHISKQIIEAHGGKLFVESSPGQGATFIAEIPLLQVDPLQPRNGPTLEV